MTNWNDQKIIEELKAITDKLGYFPKSEEIRLKIKRSDILNAVQKSENNMFYFQEKLGFKQSRKCAGYWDKNFEKELNEIIQQLGHFPTQQELTLLGKSQLYKTIHKNNKTLNDYRIKLGFSIKERDKKYWLSWDNLEKEIKPLIKNDKFPGKRLIYNELGGGAVRSISIHGGINKVAIKMGYKPSYFTTTSDGHYVHSSNEYLFDEFLYSRNIKHDVNGLIHKDFRYRYDFKIGEIYFEIWGFDPKRKQKINQEYNTKRNKKEAMYKKLKLKLISIEFDVFNQPLNKIEEYFTKLMNDLGFNTSSIKKNYNISNIINHINTWNEEKIIQELKKAIKLIGHFPTWRELKNHKMQALGGAISKYGGYHHFANKLGCKINRNPNKYWTEIKIIEELDKIIMQIKKYPSCKELLEINSKLFSAMQERKGQKYYKKHLGF